MAAQDNKISQLDLATALTGAELIPVVQSGETRKSTIADVKTLVLTNIPQWVKFDIDYSKFTSGAMAEDYSLYSLPANGYIHDVKIFSTTDFQGGTIASYRLSVGIVGSLAKYGAVTDVFTGNTSRTTVHTPIAGLESVSVATDIRLSAVTTGGNLNTATQGIGKVYLKVSKLP